MSAAFEWVYAHWFAVLFIAGEVWLIFFGRHYAFGKHDNLYDTIVQPFKDWIYARRERRWLAKQPKPDGSPYRDR